jgi:hypothetical protein
VLVRQLRVDLTKTGSPGRGERKSISLKWGLSVPKPSSPSVWRKKTTGRPADR